MGRKPIALAAAFIFLGLAEPTPADDGLTPQPVEISARDLAAVLGLKWWKYRVPFAQPVHEVSVAIHEMRRQEGGGWRKETIQGPFTYKTIDSTFSEVTAIVIIPDNKSPMLGLEIGSGGGFDPTTSRGANSKPPDFDNMAWSSKNKTIVDGCIVLAAEYKDSAITGREKDMKRIIGLEIKTK